MRTHHGIIALTLLAALTACGGDAGDGSAKDAPESGTVLEEAYSVCGDRVDEGKKPSEPPMSDFVTVGDDGDSLTISSPQSGSGYALLSVLIMQCFLNETGASDAVVSQVEQTNSLMGRQEAEWDDVTLSWSYHPDSGVSAVFSMT